MILKDIRHVFKHILIFLINFKIKKQLIAKKLRNFITQIFIQGIKIIEVTLT